MAEIPKIIHQTWKSAEVPEHLRAYRESFARLNPDYELKLWTDADNDALVSEHYPELLDLYHGLSRGIFRADLARCLYLHRFGGFYVDLDIECVRPLELLRVAGAECAIGCEPQVHAERLQGLPRLVCNAAMASIAGHPFWLAMLEEIQKRALDPRAKTNPVWATGPLCLEAVFQQVGEELGVQVWEPDVFFPLPDYESRALGLSKNEREHFRTMVETGLYPQRSFGVHHWAHTWIRGSRSRVSLARKLRGLKSFAGVLRGELTLDEALRPADYLGGFPEERFPIARKFRTLHEEQVQLGAAHARLSRVAIVSLLHNRLDTALRLRARLQGLSALFHESEFFLLGEDSTDGTEVVLRDWATSQDYRVVSVPPPELAGLSAFTKMARLRNRLLDAVRARAEAFGEPFDYILMLDGDLRGALSPIGLQHAFSELKAGADAVSAFGVNNWGGVPSQFPYLGYSYYDALAFREHEFERTRSDAALRLRLAKEKRGAPAFAVKSAFGGACLYRYSVLRDVRYVESGQDCEHVLLHRELEKRGAKLVVDPSFLLLAGRQGHHQKRA